MYNTLLGKKLQHWHVASFRDVIKMIGRNLTRAPSRQETIIVCGVNTATSYSANNGFYASTHNNVTAEYLAYTAIKRRIA